MFTPHSNLRLLSVPIEPGYIDTLWFPNVQTQTTYFIGKTIKIIGNEDFQYIKRNENVICIEGAPEDFYNINYVMYQNNNFSTKWFYAFVANVEWASMNSVNLVLEQDSIQTWFFDINFAQSFILRQHSVTDTPGDNIVPESIAGCKIIYDRKIHVDLTPTQIIIIATCDSSGNPYGGTFTDGNTAYSGARMLNMPFQEVNSFLNSYISNGLADAIVGIYCMPLVNLTPELQRYPTSIDGYTPKNNKLKTGVFIDAFASGMGQEINFNPTENVNQTIHFRVKSQPFNGTISVGVMDYALRDDNYPGMLDARQFNPMTMTLQYPKGNWAYNQYQNDYNLHSGSNTMMQTRLQHQQFLTGANGVLDTISGMAATARNGLIAMATGGMVGIDKAAQGIKGIIGGVNQTYEALQGVDEATEALQRIDENLKAPVTGLAPNSNAYTSLGWLELAFGFKVPPKDIAKRYDDYLTQFGYAQNDFGVPNLHARKAFTFVKVSYLNVYGNFPGSDMDAIRSAFSNGIRFWAYDKVFGDYTQDNGVL